MNPTEIINLHNDNIFMLETFQNLKEIKARKFKIHNLIDKNRKQIKQLKK